MRSGQAWQALVGDAPAAKRALTGTAEQLAGIEDIEMVGALDALELVPTDRGGDRCARPGPRRIRQNGRCRPLVAEEIEEDPAAPLLFGKRNGEAVRSRL